MTQRRVVGTASELAERERQLRQEILGGEPAQRGLVGGAPISPPVAEPEEKYAPMFLTPEDATLITVDFENSTVSAGIGGTIADFPLNNLELAQFAFIASRVLARNFDVALGALQKKYSVDKLVEQAQEQMQKAVSSQQTDATPHQNSREGQAIVMQAPEVDMDFERVDTDEDAIELETQLASRRQPVRRRK